MKLLISGLGGSLFPYLHNSLSKDHELFYVDADTQLKILYKDLNFFHSPYIAEDGYWDFIRKVISENRIDFYIPLIDEEIVHAKRDIEGFSGVKVISPESSFSELCLNKFLLMQKLDSENISSIHSYMGNNYSGELSYPIFIKPVSGRGSRGIRKIDNDDQLEAYYKLENYFPEEILIQPLVTGIEYTIGVVTNNLNDILTISSKRIIKKKGITQIAVTENNTLIDEAVKRIVQVMNPCGPFNVQLILTPEAELKIFEINPRFSTTSILEIEGGVDPIRAYIDHYNMRIEGEVNRPKENLYLHRRWENVFYYG